MDMAIYSTGDRVQVAQKNPVAKTYIGVVSKDSTSKVLMLRLDNGYSLGVKLGKGMSINVIGKQELKKSVKVNAKQDKNMPKISIVSTGGTISSSIDYKTGAVSPITKPEELLAKIPELTKIVYVTNVAQPFAVFSEDMGHKEWQKLAKEVASELNKGNEGVIVTHGTDTLHYTAAALSFMLTNLSKPVAVVMHGTTEDNFCLVNRGTKVRKLHSSSRDAFRPVNEMPIGRMWKDGTFEVLNKDYKKRSTGKVIADVDFESKVALLKFYPGADPDLLKYFVKKGYKGIIIEAAGLGQVATNPIDKNKSWLPAIKEATKKKVFIGFTSQAIYGRVDPFVYSNARLLKEAGAVFLEDMLSETALVKLGWVLAHSKNHTEAEDLMLRNIAGEISHKIEPRGFLY